MQLCMGYETEPARDERYEGELDAVVRRVSRHAIRRREGDPHVAAGARGGRPGKPVRHCQRFEPITVSAAARVLQLKQSGVLSATEAWFYLHELAAMDAHAGREAFPALLRGAQLHAASRLLAAAT